MLILGKNLFEFVSPGWKLNNLYYHNHVVRSWATFIWPLAELTRVQLKGNPWLFLVVILSVEIKNNLYYEYRSLLRPKKLIDDDLALNFSDGSEVWSFKTRKNRRLHLSFNSSQLSKWANKSSFSQGLKEKVIFSQL